MRVFVNLVLKFVIKDIAYLRTNKPVRLEGFFVTAGLARTVNVAETKLPFASSLLRVTTLLMFYSQLKD